MNKRVWFIVLLLLLAIFFSAGCVSTASHQESPPNPTSTRTLVPLVDNPPVSPVTDTPTPVQTTSTPVVTKTPTPYVTKTPTPVVTKTSTPVVTSTPTPINTVTSGMIYYVNKDSGIVHKSGCSYIKDTSNYDIVSDPSGYKKCSRCW